MIMIFFDLESTDLIRTDKETENTILPEIIQFGYCYRYKDQLISKKHWIEFKNDINKDSLKIQTNSGRTY